MRHPMQCEVCRSREARKHFSRHPDEQVVEVGRKANGVARIICGRRRCREVWEREKVKRMAKWPEVIEALRGVSVAPPTEVKLVPAGRTDLERKLGETARAMLRRETEPNWLVEARQQAAASAVMDQEKLDRNERITKQLDREARASGPLTSAIPASPAPETVMPTPQTPDPKRRRTVHRYPPEFYAWLKPWLIEHGYHIGTTPIIHTILVREHPAWLTKQDGELVKVNALGNIVRDTALMLGMTGPRGTTAAAAGRITSVPPPKPEPAPLLSIVKPEPRKVSESATALPLADATRLADTSRRLAESYVERLTSYANRVAQQGKWEVLEAATDLLREEAER